MLAVQAYQIIDLRPFRRGHDGRIFRRGVARSLLHLAISRLDDREGHTVDILMEDRQRFLRAARKLGQIALDFLQYNLADYQHDRTPQTVLNDFTRRPFERDTTGEEHAGIEEGPDHFLRRLRLL